MLFLVTEMDGNPDGAQIRHGVIPADSFEAVAVKLHLQVILGGDHTFWKRNSGKGDEVFLQYLEELKEGPLPLRKNQKQLAH